MSVFCPYCRITPSCTNVPRVCIPTDDLTMSAGGSHPPPSKQTRVLSDCCPAFDTRSTQVYAIHGINVVYPFDDCRFVAQINTFLCMWPSARGKLVQCCRRSCRCPALPQPSPPNLHQCTWTTVVVLVKQNAEEHVAVPKEIAPRLHLTSG